MFGIGLDRNQVLCHYGNDRLQFQSRSKMSRPVMVESATEIDNLLQEVMVAYNIYSMYVIEFTEEEEVEFLIKRLQGY